MPPRALVPLVASLAVACSGGSPGPGRPVALIDGGSLRAGYGTLVTLDAARSSDPDGDRLRYAWRIVRGPRGTKATGRADRVRFTFRTAPARSLFPVRPTFGAVAIPRGGEGDVEIELVVTDGAHRGRTRTTVRSAAPTGGWPRVETGLDLTVSCGAAEDAPARWHLVETPAASKAAVLEPDRCLARVRADRAGHYVLEEAERGKRLPFWYGDWVGHEECARPECHPSEHETWKGTRHASVFARGLDGTMGPDYGPACYGCHTLGGDPATRSLGFRRAAEAARWQSPDGPETGAYDRMPESVRLWTNVQCEQCHGPGRFWTGLSADVCAQCHDAPPRYHIVADWRRSRMSVPPAGPAASRADCASCHSAHGAIARLREKTAARPKEEPDAQGITCPVCHDPHEARFPFQLRRAGEVTVGARTVAAGKSAVCFTCHGAFAGLEALARGQAPHAPQGWMLTTPVGAEPAPHAAVPDLCVGCHMARAPRPPARAADRRVAPSGRAGEASRDAMGGHAFVLRAGRETLDLACRECHRDVRGLEIGGGTATRALVAATERLRARVRAAASRLTVRGCDGSPPADVVAALGDLVLVDALGRTLQDCAHQGIGVPDRPPALARAAAIVTLLERDRSSGAHNLPLATALVAEGLSLLP